MIHLAEGLSRSEYQTLRLKTEHSLSASISRAPSFDTHKKAWPQFSQEFQADTTYNWCSQILVISGTTKDGAPLCDITSKSVKKKKGYFAVCVELPGCVTQGETREELLINMEEALNLYLDEPADSKAIYPLPRKRVSGRAVIEVCVLPRIAFSFTLRMTRLKENLTQREAAMRIGITGSLNNYQRLENSDTANPVLETLVQIKKAFPEFPLDQIAS